MRRNTGGGKVKKVKFYIKQLTELKEHCEDMAKNADKDAPWHNDIKALDFAIENIQQNIFLTDMIIKKEREYNKSLVALFATIRNSSVLEIELREGKSLTEINKMALEILLNTMNGKIIDLEKMRKSYNEAIELYNKEKQE